MYPICNDCGHTRAEHNVQINTTQSVFPCGKEDCQCAAYVAMTDWEKKMAANVPAEPAEAKETTVDIGQAEMPTEYRIAQAYLNGYKDGLYRGLEGRLDR